MTAVQVIKDVAERIIETTSSNTPSLTIISILFFVCIGVSITPHVLADEPKLLVNNSGIDDANGHLYLLRLVSKCILYLILQTS